MVVLDIKVDNEDKSLYMDGMLYRQLTKKVIPSIKKKDFDWVVAVDGTEGGGKSVFAFQIAKILDPNFCLEQIAFTANDFVRIVVKARPHSCVVFDEAFTGLSSRSSLSEVNQLLVSLMMEMRQKNLFVILVMPTFFMLDKYAALHRCKGLFHVYLIDGNRSFWGFYSKQAMKMLYFKGRQYYEYHYVKATIFGRFRNQYTINEEQYRVIKKQSLGKKRRKTRADVYKSQRDLLIYDYYKKEGDNVSKTTRYLGILGLGLQRRAINDIVLDERRRRLAEE